MTNAERLVSIFKIRKEYRQLQELREVAFNSACKSTTVYTSLKTQSTKGNLQEEKIIDLLEIDERLKAKSKEFRHALLFNYKIIHKIKAEQDFKILFNRYYLLKNWNEIASLLNLSRRYILKRNKEILKQL